MTNNPAGVVFGHMHEDHTLELSLIPRMPVRRALVIASGGDLALALAGKRVEVLAVDSNPAQTALVRRKMTCPPAELPGLCFCGKVDRVLRAGGGLASWLLDWPRRQPGKIRRCLTNRLESLLPRAVRLIHGPEAAARLNRHAVRLMRDRLEKAMATVGASRNPLLQALLGKRFGPVPPPVWSPAGIEEWRPEIHRISLWSADLGQALTQSAEASFGLISVSNLPDTMSPAAWSGLSTQIAAALAPGGFLVVRSMLTETPPPEMNRLFESEEIPAADQSPLCPVIWAGRKRFPKPV